MHVRKNLKGSMTVELSFLMPIILLLIMSSILAAFYFHDKNVLAGAAYETAVVGSTKIREKEKVTGGELEALFRERAGRKCILFAESSVRASVGKREIRIRVTAYKGRFRMSADKKAAITEPEKYIRDIRKAKERADGTKDYH